MKNYERLLSTVIITVGITMVVYHLVSVRYLFYDSFLHQNTHLGLALLLVFLTSIQKSKRKLWPLLLALFSLLSTTYVFVFYQHLSESWGVPDPQDVVIGVILVIVVLEATRRSWGWETPTIALLCVLYFLYGHLLPFPFNHEPYKFGYVISNISVGLRGIYGSILDASASYVFLLIVFGGCFELVRLFPLLMELGKSASRLGAGGAGMMAVVSSTLVGMITGAAVANATICGSFTIPAMKKAGFTPDTAAAIEGAASTGAQLMPPIMGTAAFLMTAIIGVPYATIMAASLIPGLLYYFQVGVAVRCMALKESVKSSKEPADWRLVVHRLPLFLIPLSLVIILLMMGYSAGLAGFVGVISLLAASFILKETRPSVSQLIHGMSNAAILGAKVGIACACIGLLNQTMITSGIGARIADAVEAWAGGNLVIALFITMAISFILGLGLPTVTAYALVGIVVAPVLVRMGVPLLAAHFFAFYFAIVSALTPPVALAVLPAASLAGANYMRASWIATWIGVAAYILPFIMIFNQAILGNFSNPVLAIASIVGVALALLNLSSALYGYFLTKLSAAERLAFGLLAAVFITFAISQVNIVLVIGLAIFIVIWFRQMNRKKQEERVLEPVS